MVANEPAYGVLVAEPVGALDRVVHVEVPIVSVAHIAERGGSQSGATRADDHDVIGVLDNLVSLRHCNVSGVGRSPSIQ